MKPKNKYQKDMNAGEKGTEFEKKKRKCPFCSFVLKKFYEYRKHFPFGSSQKPRYEFKHTKFTCLNKTCPFRKDNKIAYKEYSPMKIINPEDSGRSD